MGSSARAPLPTMQKMRSSSALHHRISLNKETLDRILQHIRHPLAAQQNRVSVLPRQRLKTPLKPPSAQQEADKAYPTTPLQEAIEACQSPVLQEANKTYRSPSPKPSSAASILLPPAAKKQVDTNKPLPPLPLTTSFCELEQQLEHDFVQRQRDLTLRILESRHAATRRRSRTRVPDIILSRIEKGARATRRELNRGSSSSGLAGDHMQDAVQQHRESGPGLSREEGGGGIA
ncbi:hypothetical protein N658DRAFT_252628 [Parathielavia hyrcaniae]|uniref:Uncharacterized protein n=1 Tax=Parathielavia hyrcaniae TaxID=113614 RepID=A0AAN6PZ26_9PEZI|nr:hypothetical protein N658DRAFT_252628 [Parathielavia hyrcaniae]